MGDDLSFTQAFVQLCGLWDRLVEPAAFTQEPEKRQRARFLASLLVALFLASLLFMAVSFLTKSSGQLVTLPEFIPELASLLILGLAFYLNRNGRYFAAAGLLIVLSTVAIFILGFPFDTPDDVHFLYYLTIPTIIAGLLLPLRLAAALDLAGLLALLVLAALPGADLAAIVYGPFAFMLFATAVLLVAVTHRNQLEQTRQAQMQQSKIVYRQLVEFSPEPILIYDGKVIVFCNVAAADLFGVANPKALLGQSLDSFMPPDAGARSWLAKTLATKQVIRQVEQRFLRRDGTPIAVEVSATPILYQDKPALQLLCRNITQHKQQQATERSRRIVAEITRDYALALHSSLNLDDVLEQLLVFVRRVLPYDAASIRLIEAGVARPAYSLGYAQLGVDPVEAKLSMAVESTPGLRQVVETRQPLVIADVLNYPDWLHIDGTEWIRSNITAPIRLNDEVIGFITLDSRQPRAFAPEAAGVLQTFADQASIAIQNAMLYETLQRATEQMESLVAERTLELFRVKERAETILHNTSEAVILLHEDGKIQQVNPAFTNLFGLSGDEAFGQSLVDLVSSDSTSAVTDALAWVLIARKTAHVEITMRGRDDATIVADATLASITGVGSQRLIVCSLRDITARKQVEAELRTALQRERELSELKSRFTAMMSHEFRTPLAVIHSSSDLLKLYGARLSDERKREHLETIQANVNHMVAMLEDAQVIGGGDSAQRAFHPAPFDLETICRQAVDGFETTIGSTYALEFEGLPQPVEVVLDARLMLRMLRNLLSNAAKYSAPGSTIRVRLECTADTAIIRVQDEGIGIPPEEQAHIFDLFHRGANVSNIAGIGLGLPVVKEIVDLHGGTIQVDNTAETGTTFVVQLPRHFAPPSTETLPEPAEQLQD